LEDRKRTIFAVIIALIVVLALLYSFGLNLFSTPPQLDMADPNEAESQGPSSADPGDNAGILVVVRPDTVQSVIASLSRYESYSRTMEVTYYWGDEQSGTISAQVWEADGWTRTETILMSGATECSIVGEGTVWLWYDDGTENTAPKVYQGSADEPMSDRLQYLPTYEDVLALNVESITDASYLEYNGQPCIYVEAEQPDLGYLYRYWISAISGLLMASETEKSGVLVYRMESNEVIAPLSEGEWVFTLPDGTVLHAVG